MKSHKKKSLVNLRRDQGEESKKEEAVKIKVSKMNLKEVNPKIADSKFYEGFSAGGGSEKEVGEKSEKNEKPSAGFDFRSSASKISGILDGITRWLLYLLVFLLPIFVLPFSVEIYEFNKTLLLFIISSLAFLIWMAKMILLDKRLIFARTPLDLPIIIFVSLILVSTVFSVDRISSILGFYGRFSDSFMVYLSLAMFYFVAVNVGMRSVIARSPTGRRGNLDVNGDDYNDMSSDDGNGIASVVPSDSGLSRNDSNITANLIKAFLASSFIVVIAGLLYSFGFKFIPFSEAQFRSFNLVGGSLNILGVYLIPVVLMALYYRSHGELSNVLKKHLMSILVIMSLVLLALIDFVLAWIVMAVSLGIVLLLILMKGRQLQMPVANAKSVFAPVLAIILISFVFIATSLTFVNKNARSDLESSLISASIRNRLINLNNDRIGENDGFAREVVLGKNTAFFVVLEGLKKIKEEPVTGIVGSGPGTYLYNFSRFKPAEFNNNPFWNIRFDKAGSEILEKISTIGVLGTLSYLLIIVFVMMMFLKSFFRRRHSRISPSDAYLFAAWFGLLLFQFLYLESTATKFVFWLLTVIIAIQYYSSSKEHNNNYLLIDLRRKRILVLASVVVFLIISSLFISSYYYQFKFYKAEATYKNLTLEQNSRQETENLESIVRSNPYRGEYKVYLADVYLRRAILVLQEENKKPEKERNIQRVGLEAKSAIDSIKTAVDLSPNNVVFQQKLGDVYAIVARDLGIEKADEWAIKGYEKAIELDPANPALYTSLGQVYVLRHSRTNVADEINKAIQEFKKALELKKDYIDAGFHLGLAYEAQGNSQEAIEQLSSLGSVERIKKATAAGQIVNFTDSIKTDVDIAFQLGRIYYNVRKIDEAKGIFLEIIKINPRNSNARYSLGLIYKREGNNEKALREFEFVLAMNPGNSDVMKKIDELKELVSGKEKKEKVESEEEVEE
jgi:tetratricopeptide (TPR) repeat protein